MSTYPVQGPQLPDVARIRADFPILNCRVNGVPLVYLDNAASSQMPQAVIDRLVRYQTSEHSNIHSAVHTLSEIASAEYEAARAGIARFINARDPGEVIFTSGTTEAINLAMHGYGRKFIGTGDEIIVTILEHHSNLVPWQMLAGERGAKLRAVPVNDAGELNLEELERLFSDRTRLLCVTHVSNALGTVTPVKRIIAAAHALGVPVLVDGAQAVSHLKVDVQDLDCDFYAFSGHKVYGPTGIGVLYGKGALLERMQPFKGGGGMISSVSLEKTTYRDPPYRFEAGTPPIAAAIGLGAAVDYVQKTGMDAIAAVEQSLLKRATERLAALPGVRIIGTAAQKAAVLSFVINGVPPRDVGRLLNERGIAVRTGHHCAQPLMQRMGIPATTRASFAFYNTLPEVDALVEGVRHVQTVLSL